MVYVCHHYADPFAEIQFSTLKDAKQYAEAYKKVTGKETEIEEREAAMISEQKCPKCGGNIVYDDIIDTDYCDGVYCDKVVGHCEKCGQDYIWNDIFKYDHTENLQASD